MHEVVRVDANVTSLTALRNAIYRMSGELGLACRQDDDSYVIESVVPTDDETTSLLLRHINDYQLRELVSERTAGLRDAILGAALLRLAEPEADE